MKAVQQREPFTTDDLRQAELVVHPIYQIPAPATGTSAVVFKAIVAREAQALRFFTREDTRSSERYSALHDHFAAQGLANCVAMPSWVNDGIRANGRTWPVVRMQWVDGHTLNKYVEDLVQQQNTPALGTLAAAWLELVTRLQRAEFAHGDLQHGNVMVDARGDMRLVDFDCSWIVRFTGQPAPSETGHRNYQLENRPWGQWMDTFPGLVVYTSLLALSKDPSSWYTLNTGENLLFRSEDFRPPFHTPTWAHLSSIQDRQLDQLVGRLRECCAPGWVASGGLKELLGPQERPWWERTSTTVAAAGTPATAQTPQPPPQLPLPAPIPTQWTAARQTPTPELVQQPTQNWWHEQSARGKRRHPIPGSRQKKPATGRIITAALGLGLVSGILTGGLVEDAGGEGAIGVLIGLFVAIVVLLVGFATKRVK